jgi:2-dehydro-3-deoxygluconokinase
MNAPPALVCIGEPLVEFTEAPGPGGEPVYLRGFGGDTSNTAIAAARQGALVGYLTAVSDDAFGDGFMRLWKQEGVDASRVRRDPKASIGLYYVFPQSEGRHFVYFRAGSAASLLGPEDVPEDYVKAAEILHVSGISQAISASACDAVFRAMAVARENRVRVSYDSNLRLTLWPLARARAVIHEAMRQCDIALPSLDDSERLTGLSDPDAVADFYLSLGAEVVALKMGARGSLVAAAGRRARNPAIPCEPIDSTGAGDTFDGAFLAEYLAHGDPFRAARYANAAAALSTTGLGAVAPIPTRQRVEAFIAETGA